MQIKNKYIKEKEKEVNKLEQKCENLASNLRNCKSENSSFKSENKKFLKKQKQAKLKIQRCVSTNTIPLEMSDTPYLVSVGSGSTTSYTSGLCQELGIQDSSSSLFSTKTTKVALSWSPTSSSTSMISNMSCKSMNATTSMGSVAASNLTLVSKLEQSNNNSIAATNLEDNIEHSAIKSKEVEDNAEKAEIFLTVEGVSAILEKAMKKQRADIKILAN